MHLAMSGQDTALTGLFAKHPQVVNSILSLLIMLFLFSSTAIAGSGSTIHPGP